jgi:hypothetical protein
MPSNSITKITKVIPIRLFKGMFPIIQKIQNNMTHISVANLPSPTIGFSGHLISINTLSYRMVIK